MAEKTEVQEVTVEQRINPSPVPTTFQVAAVTDNNSGQQLVMMVISSPTGNSVYFLDSNFAQTVGEALYKTAEQTKGSGLIVPSSGLAVPSHPSH